MGFVLNCSGRDNTLITLSKGFGCTVPELEMVLLDIVLEKVITAAPHIPKTANQLLFEYTINNLTEPDEVISAFWFHSTRTLLITISRTAFFQLTIIRSCYQNASRCGAQ